MKLKLSVLIYSMLIISSLISSCKTIQKENKLSQKSKINNHTHYQGRINTDSLGRKILYWSGSSAEMLFKGSKVSFSLQDNKGNNYFHVILDEKIIDVIRPKTTITPYEYVIPNSKIKHTFELLKISEFRVGTTSFSGFDIGDGEYYSIPQKNNQIVYYGNSITCGYAVDDITGDSPDSTYTNFHKSYAWVAAKYFDADYQSISKSGIGIMISWFDLIMPQLYNRTNPNDPNSKWDYSNDNTDIVVINLFQNDSWLINKPEMKVFKDKFGTKKPTEDFIIEAYTKFISTVRSSHPHAAIICLLGNMDITKKDSKWPGYVRQAMKKSKDKNIYSAFAPYKNTDGHPEEADQIKIADALISLIEKQGLLK